MFLRKGVLKICSKFTGEHSCPSVISIKLQSNFVEIALWYRCSLVNLLYNFRTLFLKNASGWLLLYVLNLTVGQTMLIEATPVDSRIWTFGLSGDPQWRFMVFVKSIHIVFVKGDFHAPAPAMMINSFRNSMDTFLLASHVLNFFLVQSCNSLDILRCWVFNDKIKLLGLS